MKKYVLYYDYKASHKGQGWDYKVMQATTLLEAIAEADAAYDENEIYLLRIMEKTGRTETRKFDVCKETYKVDTYSAILCKRSWNGWHLNDKNNHEEEHVVEHAMFKGGYEDFELIK